MGFNSGFKGLIILIQAFVKIRKYRYTIALIVLVIQI